MEITERQRGGITVLVVTGKITKGEGERMLRDRLVDLHEGGHTQVVVNLDGVPYIDSSGLGELVRGYTAIRRAGGRLGLTHLNARLVDLQQLRSLFERQLHGTDGPAANRAFWGDAAGRRTRLERSFGNSATLRRAERIRHGSKTDAPSSDTAEQRRPRAVRS